jgi:hypothetical protein
MVRRHRQDMQRAIEHCRECHEICLEVLGRSLEGVGAADHPRVLLDCAEICRTCSDFMLRGSDLHPITCRACAEICERCAEACERSAGGDELLKACAQICRRCAASCAAMAGTPAAAAAR